MRFALFSGSLAAASANRAVLEIVASLLRAQGHQHGSILGVADIPVFDPALVDSPPASVARLRAELEAADGIVFAVPEYAGGAAGAVKNTLDWMVGSGSLYRRVVAVISAATTGGPNAIEQTARTLAWQGAHVVGVLGVAAPRTKIDGDGRVTDGDTLEALASLTARLVGAIDVDDAAQLALVESTLVTLGIDPYDRRSR